MVLPLSPLLSENRTFYCHFIKLSFVFDIAYNTIISNDRNDKMGILTVVRKLVNKNIY